MLSKMFNMKGRIVLFLSSGTTVIGLASRNAVSLKIIS